jgi:hypothetical protein
MRVRSIEDEIGKRGWARVKSLAVQKQLVPELFCEADLVDDSSSTSSDDKAEIDLDFLKGCKAARHFANGTLESQGEMSADACTAILETKVSQLLAMDPAFAVEIAFFTGMTGESADKRVCNMILACMPTEGDKKTPQQAQELVAILRNKKVLQFCTAAGKAAYSTAVEMVAALCMDKRPQLPQAGCAGAFVQDLNKSLAYFVRQEVDWQ